MVAHQRRKLVAVRASSVVGRGRVLKTVWKTVVVTNHACGVMNLGILQQCGKVHSGAWLRRAPQVKVKTKHVSG